MRKEREREEGEGKERGKKGKVRKEREREEGEGKERGKKLEEDEEGIGPYRTRVGQHWS